MAAKGEALIVSNPERFNVAPALDIATVRAQFPAPGLKDGRQNRIYFDNPAGTQVPRQVIDRIINT